MIMRRFLAVSAALIALAAVLAIEGHGKVKGQGTTPQVKSAKDGQSNIDIVKNLAKVEKELSEKYSTFEKSLLTLSQRLANSADEKDKSRAVQLQKVLETATGRDISTKFNQFYKFLSQQNLISTGPIDEAVRQSVSLAKDLKEILDLLRNDNGAGNKKEERIALEKLVKEIERLIRDEQLVRSQIPTNPDKAGIAKDQSDVTQKTADLENKMDGKGGEGKDPKDQKGTAKEAGKGSKADGKALGKPSDVAKAGDAKDPGKEGGEAKNAGKEGEKKEGKEGKEGGDKAVAKGEAKKGSDIAKGGEPKPGEGKKSDASKAPPSEAKAGSPSDSPGESKPGKDSKSQGAAKASPKSGGQKSDEPPQVADGKSDNQPSPKANPDDPKDSISTAKKRVQEAQKHMERVTDDIAKGQRDPAGKEADQAVEKLEAARRKLEELLRQLREEELERVLAALISRCQKMLAMQEEVLRGTLRVQARVETNPSQKPDRDNVLASLNLSDDELKIVYEATKAIEILEAEGSAVAFPEVFQQVREDMKHVQRRLKNTDVGDITVTIEQDIVETLKEMIKALEKAKKEMEQKDPKKAEDPPPPSKQQDQKLLDKIAELKMIKAMQLRVNARTELYGKRFQGEQAMTEDIRIELRELAGRQDRIFEVTSKMAKGDGQ
jgi:hypothetical protein